MYERSTNAPEPALGRQSGLRTEGPGAFKRAAARHQQEGAGEGLGERQRGHGQAYRCWAAH